MYDLVPTSHTLLSPLVTRDAVVSVYAPGRTLTESPARTMRAHHTMSAGFSRRPRSTDRPAGQERLYSLVNLAAAMLDRRGQRADARSAAEVSGVLEQWANDHVSTDVLIDCRASGRSADRDLFALALASNRLLEQLLSRLDGQAIVDLTPDTEAGSLAESMPGTVLTFRVPLVRFTLEDTGDAPAVPLADALASLRLPGAFDVVGDKDAEAARAGNRVAPPTAFRW